MKIGLRNDVISLSRQVVICDDDILSEYTSPFDVEIFSGIINGKSIAVNG